MRLLATSRLAVLVAVLLPAPGLSARVSDSEAAHFSFHAPDCRAKLIPDRLSATDPSLHVYDEAGATCHVDRVGISLNATCTLDNNGRHACHTSPGVLFKPVVSDGGGFPATLGGGITIEMWLRAREIPSDWPALGPAHRVLAALSSSSHPHATACTSVETTGGQTPISFAIQERADGCISLKLKVPDTAVGPRCITLPDGDDDSDLCPTDLKLNQSATAPQHLVITLSNATAFRAAGSEPRFSMYINGVRAIESEIPYKPGGYANIALRRGFLTGEVLNNLYNGGVHFLDLPNTWYADHRLRFGTLSLPAFVQQDQAWVGDIDMFAMYSRPLTLDEVQANWAAGVDNSYPVAHNLSVVVDEDSCTRLPTLASSATDWDNYGPLQRGQTLTAGLEGLPTIGTLHSDAGCTSAPLARGGGTLPNVYYQPPPDGYSVGGSNDAENATLAWSISDGKGGSSVASLEIAVRAVNDPPVATASALEAYMTVRTLFNVTGTDVDSADLSDPVWGASIKVTRAPAYGSLTTDAGVPIIQGDIVPTISIAYTSEFFPRTCTSTCPRVVGTDSFEFELVDTDGAPSLNQAAVTIDIISGLDTVSTHFVAEEEWPKTIYLKGINQRDSPFAFELRNGSSHGRLFQHNSYVAAQLAKVGTDASAVCDWTPQPDPCCDAICFADLMSAIAPYEITSLPANVTDVNPCASEPDWSCASLVYVGDRDWFSYPQETLSGVDLNVRDDSMTFVMVSSAETSAESVTTVRVNNVNDPPVLILPGNVSFSLSYGGDRRYASIGTGVQIIDPDHGLGFWYVELRADGLGRLTQLTHKQPSLSFNEPIDPSKWQYSIDAIETELGYCPPMCVTNGVCTKDPCIKGREGSLEVLMRVFGTPQAVTALIHDLLYRTSDPSNQEVSVKIIDFKKGRQLPPVSGAISLVPEVTCAKFVGTACTDDLPSGGGTCGPGPIITPVAGGVSVAIVVLSWLFVCCRQRSRTALRDARGRRKPRSLRATTDMRCLVPTLATVALVLTSVSFLMRCRNNPYTLYKMDFWSDGYCGPNATSPAFGITSDPPPTASASSPGNASTDPASGADAGRFDNSVGFNNHGCTAGVPSGFEMTRMMGDMLVIGVAYSLVLIEVSGRPYGRALAGLIAFVAFLYTMIKFGLWEAFDLQHPETAACADQTLCPSFYVEALPTEDHYAACALQDDSAEEAGYAICIGRCDNDIRGYQSDLFIFVIPAVGAPALVILAIVACYGCRALFVRGGRDSEDCDSDSDSDDDSRRQGRGGRGEREKHRGDGRKGDKRKGDGRDRDRRRDKDRDRRREKNRRRPEESATRRRRHESDEDEEDEEDGGALQGNRGKQSRPRPPPRAPSYPKPMHLIRCEYKPPLPARPYPGTESDAPPERGPTERSKPAPPRGRSRPAPPRTPKPPPPSRPYPGTEEESTTTHMNGIGEPSESERSEAAVEAKGKRGKGVTAPRVPGMARLGFGANRKGPAKGDGSTNAEEMIELKCSASSPPGPPSAHMAGPPVEWFYMDISNEQQGPVDEDGLRRLYALGDIHDFTFVWNEAMPSWVPMKDAPGPHSGMLPGAAIAACHGGLATC